jgi:hypothetical protein
LLDSLILVLQLVDAGPQSPNGRRYFFYFSEN